MKKLGRGIAYAMIILGYVALAILIMYLLFNSGKYPSGTNVMSHLYKGNFLYQQIKTGNWYPLLDSMWYNGAETIQYWAPIPVYLLAFCQALVGGSYFLGYLLFVGLVFFLGALLWFHIGRCHERPWLGALLGVFWFFMPNNLMTLLVDGDLPHAVCMLILPLFISYVHDYLLESRWSSLPKMILCFFAMTLCQLWYAGMIALALLVFLLIQLFANKNKGKVLHVIVSVCLGFLLTGIWSYASWKKGSGMTANAQTLKRFFQSAAVSLNPMHRISDGQSVIYFGLAAFILILFGMFFSRKKSLPGFWTAGIIFLCTTTFMYPILVKLPGSQYLRMLQFIPIALCFTLYSFLLWKSLKKPFACVVTILLALDIIPSLTVITGNAEDFKMKPELRYDVASESTLIDEAKVITKQRLSLMDSGILGADGAYMVSRPKDGVAAVFGADTMSSTTSSNTSLLEEAMEGGHYLYLFDRSIELGSDTVWICEDQLQNQAEDVPALDEAAGQLGYLLVDEYDGYRIYHKDTPGTFGVKSQYKAIGIGTSASLMSLSFPSIEETSDTNLNHYTYDELKQYETIYLAGFTVDDRQAAEDMVLKLTRHGVKVVVLADGLPTDQETGLQTFAGVTCQSITFSNGYPEIDTKNGVIHPDLFPEGYTNWKTVYLNGLDDVLGTTVDGDEKLDCLGTKDNDNLIFIGLNLTYHYALTQDANIGSLLAEGLSLDATEVPERELVPIQVTYDKNEITIQSSDDDVNTTIAYHDNYQSKQNIYEKNNLTYVNKGKTIITMKYLYLKEGLLISGSAILLTVLFLVVTWRKAKKGRL